MILRKMDFSHISKYDFCTTTPDFSELYKILEANIQVINPKAERVIGGTDNVQKICLTPESNLTDDDIVYAISLDGWGAFYNLYAMIQANLVTAENINSRLTLDQWREYITLSGGRQDNTKTRKRKFLSDRYRITNMATSGPLRFVPIIQKTNSHLTKDHKYGGTYAIDFYRRDSKRRKKAQFVLDRLSDAQSKDVFEGSLLKDSSHIWDNYFSRLQSNPQYFDYVHLNSDSVIINCGVAGGEEIPLLLSYDVSKIVNIDPSGERLLTAYTQHWINCFPEKSVFLEHAIWNDNENIRIPVHTASGYVEKVVEAKTLQTIINEQGLERVDLIKADLEGVERRLLPDICKIVDEFRPQLAISIYHSADDLVDIPIALMNHCKDYDFFIQNYSYESVEMILYCIPKELRTSLTD